MLDAGRSPQQIGGLTVFFDHADENRRYVLAQTPRLVANPDPQLSLIIFRGTENGGLLQFEARLAPTAEELARVEQELSANGRPPVLSRPDWRSGTIQVAGWLHTTELAPKLLVTGMPSLVGDPVGVLSARLDADGAALADAALRGNALPTVVIFTLDTLGLAGPLSVEADADLQALHDRLTAEGALTTPYGRAHIAQTWESAERDNLIRIRVVDESGDVDGQRAEAMRRIGEDLLARMFSPFPPSEQPPQLNDEAVAPIELSFRLTIRREELTTTEHWSFRERQAVPIRHYAAASLIDLLGDSPASAHISFADLTDIRHDIVVRAEPELGKLGMAAMEVDLRESEDDAVERTIVLTDAQPEVRLPATQTGGLLRYRVRARFDPTMTSAENTQSEWLDAPGNLVVVSGRRLFPPHTFSVIAGRVEFDWLDRIEVVVETPAEPAHTLLLSAETQSAEVFLPGAGRHALTMTTHWRGRRDEPSRTDASRDIDEDLVILDSPFADSINVLLVPLPLSGVPTIIVELRSTQRDFVDNKTISWDAPDREPRRVGLRRLDGSLRQFSYRMQFIHDDGTVDQKAWVETTDTTLIVGADGPMDVRTADVVVLGGGPAGRDSVAIELVLEAGSARTTKILEGTDDSATLVLVTQAGAPPAVLTAREYLSSGDVHESQWTDPPALTVMPSIPTVTP